jgi:hypothetical protein
MADGLKLLIQIEIINYVLSRDFQLPRVETPKVYSI